MSCTETIPRSLLFNSEETAISTTKQDWRRNLSTTTTTEDLTEADDSFLLRSELEKETTTSSKKTEFNFGENEDITETPSKKM